ncbi:MAG: AAA family ATPase, partial [Candidatus Dormibacteraeota bacterium]|nr:AAA family ATPase [Candidatus Dormibacteraeota bacterium]
MTKESTGTISLLFTDLVGSTELLTDLGDEAAEAIRRTHFRLLRDAVRERGGQEVKNLGDGLMVVFKSAVEAIACAEDVQRRVYRLNSDGGERQMQVRVGIHVGEPIRDEDDYFGTPVVVAKRLCDAAGGGEVLVSDLAHKLVGSRGDHRFEDRGAVPFKGLPDQHVWALRWEPTEHTALPLPLEIDLSTGRPAAFVGRDEVMAEMRAAWRRMHEGRRQVLLIGGEAGMGKTRVAAELAAELHAEGAVVLYGRCDEDGVVPYQPFAEALRHYVERSQPEELRLHLPSTASHLARLVPDVDDRLPGGGAVPAEDATGLRYRLFEALATLLCSVARSHPVLLVIDDLHWMDQPTAMMLRHFVRSTAHCRITIIGTWRDNEVGRRSPMKEVIPELRRDAGFRSVQLSGLATPAVEQMMASAAGHELTRPGRRLAEILVRETEGNPFFLNEILLHLLEEGAIYRGEGGRWRTRAGSASDVDIPESVWDVIGQRLGQLSEAANGILEVASVVGREFGLDVLQEVTEESEATLLDLIE